MQVARIAFGDKSFRRIGRDLSLRHEVPSIGERKRNKLGLAERAR
jgi:hypothetical protein